MKPFLILLISLGLCSSAALAHAAALDDDTRFDILYVSGDETNSTESPPTEETATTTTNFIAANDLQNLLYHHIKKYVPADEAAFIADCILKSGKRHDVDPLLAAALFEQESGFRPGAYSIAGAKGIAQLMPTTAAALGVDINDTAENIDGGIMYLRDLLSNFAGAGDMQYTFAVAAYNAGGSAVRKYQGVPPYTETRQHVSAVAQNYQALSQAAGL